jgi:subtilase family serine protease
LCAHTHNTNTHNHSAFGSRVLVVNDGRVSVAEGISLSVSVLCSTFVAAVVVVFSLWFCTGTSASTPIIAAILALVNDARAQGKVARDC